MIHNFKGLRLRMHSIMEYNNKLLLDYCIQNIGEAFLPRINYVLDNLHEVRIKEVENIIIIVCTAIDENEFLLETGKILGTVAGMQV